MIITVAALCLLTVPAAWVKALKAGAIMAVTGPASFLGGPKARTLEMQMAELNAKGSIKGDKIKMIIQNTANSSDKAISCAKQLIEEDLSSSLSSDHPPPARP
jgi:branched-chain amino acid transport system substrate-binding protein